ncbi:hypothetical protein [Bathymodiolus thermophilus thioautotrophic gill symbiont]|uniref:NERD domain-containing protein n=1 Tax=Bathymodiolus thermophilus thioautotrophic gill symbiont TaxID=2360 RepID=A0A1J5TU79_9GAMM|nr:hypothetical protein [Bathymodiolus thermophilus thioautotrophic gill symbiont]OIR24379.1 hypothetical protein BGC33_03400 [Bathymodiolus thermophilus thioautotrophic gill symbiont]
MSELELKFKAKYSNYLSDFKTMSIDKEHPNKTPLCIDTYHKFYNFDEIVKNECPRKHPASLDTLILKKNTIYCIEFRNLSKVKTNKHKNKLQNKLQEGKDALLGILKNLSIQHKGLEFIFCVVYKTPKQGKYNYADNIASRVIHFDLSQYKPSLYNDIYTQPVDFFRKEFIKKINPTLPC